jgi:predicted nucleic acid-binding protein
VLLDSSARLRILQPRHPHYAAAARALEWLPQQGRQLHIVPQNLVELWVVATRLAEQNGLGMTPRVISRELARLKDIFVLLPETPAIYPMWEELVLQYQVSGKPAHDARLVAAMKVHGLSAILSFDRSGFSRFAGIEVLHRADVTPGALRSSAKD